MYRPLLLVGAFACLLSAPSPVAAAFYGWSLTIDDSNPNGNPFNAPDFTLTNDPLSFAPLESFTFTIGDTSFNFDVVQNIVPTGSLITPDTLNNKGAPPARDDLFRIDNLGLAPGAVATWEADVDSDASEPPGSVPDSRDVFFNNASASNSIATAYFGDGSQLAIELPDDDPGLSTYNYVAVVPLPAALPLFAGGLAGIAWVAHRRREQASG